MSSRAQRVGFELLERRALLAHVGLDLQFGDNGRGPADATLLVSSLPDGRALAVGKKRVTRLNADGSIDSSFFDAGGAQAAEGKMNWVAGDAVISGDRLYVAGVLQPRTFSNLFSGNVVFVRAVNLADGSLVDSFGDHGFMTTVIGSIAPGAGVYSVTTPFLDATPDGGFAFAVAHRNRDAVNDPNGAVTLYRANARGRFDFSFGGGDGEVIVREGFESDLRDLAVDSQGRILLMHKGEQRRGTLNRFLGDGTLDETFGENGAGDLSQEASFPRYIGFTRDADDSLLIPIMSDGDLGTTGYLRRTTADGGSAKLSTFPGRGASEVGIPAVDAQGRIVVTVDETLVRLTSDFELDPTFGEDGVAPFPTGFHGGRIAFDASGAILVGNGEGVSRYLLDVPPVALGEDGILRLEGNEDANRIVGALDGRFLNVTMDGQVFTFRAADVTAVQITARGGSNDVTLNVNLPATVSAGNNDDTIRISGSADTAVMPGAGDDFVQTGNGEDRILAEGRATILSGGGDDQIGPQEFGFGVASYLEVDAGPGNDVIYAGSSESFIWAGDGNDLIRPSDVSNQGFHRLNGEGGDDTITGGQNVDIINGGPGNDTIDAAGGMNTIDGVTSIGADMAEQGFTYANGVLGFVGGSERDYVQVFTDSSGRGIVSRSILFSPAGAYFTTLDLSAIRRVEMTGQEGDDRLQAYSGVTVPVVIDGGGGNDEITGGSGDDSLYGGDGNDSLFGDAGNDVMRGEAGDDYFEGGKGDDMLFGQGGSDALFGLDGNDTLFSNDGAPDTVRGGAGTDRADADDADDILGIELQT